MTYIDHKDGVEWWNAPQPRRWHRCWPQTFGIDQLTAISRCACGAIRLENGPWIQRNSRKGRHELA